jgi:hypothetical protein
LFTFKHWPYFYEFKSAHVFSFLLTFLKEYFADVLSAKQFPERINLLCFHSRFFNDDLPSHGGPGESQGGCQS